MVVSDASIHNIMGGMESTAGVRLHNHRRKLKQRFDIIKKLGQGTYGKVQLGINKETGQEVAIKTIKKAKIETEADLVRIRREIQIMSSVQHPNIIHIYEVFENREKMVLVMEYAAGGELYDFLSERKVLAEEEARRIFRQIATAVYYCHKHKICHRDLKLENILLDEHGSAKIADFGLSNVFDEQRLLNTFCGSPLYASPEIVKGTPYHGPEVDCWSLGVLLYTLVYGAMPFDGSNFKRLVKQISQGDYFEPKKPSPASPLIREMLTVTPARRADIEKICSHWWVNEGHTESCLDIAEDLANQTPVRLDLLLSLVPPPPAVGSDKMLLTNEQGGGDSRAIASDQLGPARCHSVGSLMELDQPSAERRIRDFEREKRRGSGGGDAKDAPKRKLEDGISTEDAAHGGAKRKERNRRKDREQSADRKPSTARSSSQSRQASDTEDNRQNVAAAEEKMDVDVDVGLPEPVSSEIPKEINEPPSGSGETLKSETLIALDTAEGCKDDTVTQKTAEKDPIKATVARDRPTRKSVKGSTKKSKPSSVGSVPSNIEAPSTKETEPEVKSTRSEEEGTNVEKNAEETSTTPPVASSESNKTKEGTDEPPVEAVKPKVKKKKKVLNSSKSEDTPIENAQNSTGEVGVIESSLKATEAKSNLDEGSSQETKEAVSKTEVDEDKTEKNSDVSDKISKNSVSSSKDSGENKTVAGVKTKKSRGDLSLGKLGSGTDKAEELASLAKPVERRRSKIFENADKFNIFLGGSDLKSPTTEKPKKVFIPGVKVSDYKQAFERKSSLSSPSLPTPVKNSPSKKTVEQNSKIIPTKNSSCDNVNVDASNIVKSDVEKSLNVTEMVTEFGSSTPKQSDDSQSLKQAETMHELSKHNQSSVESSPPQTNKVNSVDQNTKLNKEGSNEIDLSSEKTTMEDTAKDEETDLKLVPALQVTDKVAQQEKARIKKLKDAVEIISNAIAEENKRESDPTAVKKVSSAKPPVPSSPDKLKTKSTGSSNSSPKSPPMSPIDSSSGKKTIRVQIAPNDVRTATVQVSTPQSTNFPFDDSSITKPSAGKCSETSSETKTAEEAIQNEESNNGNKEADTSATTKIETNLDTAGPAKKKSAKVEIILKSATLPRRRTSKAEIQLGFPPSSQPASRLETGAPGEYRTEVEHMVGSTAPSRLQTQRSEVAFPVAAATSVKPLSLRSSSLEPEGTPSSKSKPRERIIPIHFERDTGESSAVSSPPPAKPPVPPVQPQRLVSQRSSSLSRQSTQDSDTDSTISATGPEPIRKSPREYIIPIAVEGGGYVTPRAGSLEPSVSETSTEASRHQHRSSGRFSKPRRMSLLSDSGASEDEGFNSLNSPFSTLQRHSSLGKDDPDDDRPFHHMHRLRSSRPSRRAPLEHNDSLSSAEEEDDDDDGFEILTAESLFSTLLSRVRSLTQRLNVEDGGRPGFPQSRLLSHLASSGHASPTSGFWSNTYGRPGEPLSRRVSENSQFSRPFGHDGEGPTPWRRSTSRDVSDGDSVYSETANSMTGGGTLPRGSSRFDCGSTGDDAGSELNSPYYYTPSLARRMQRQWHSSSQDIGSQSTMNQHTQPSDADWLVHKKDYLPPLRKSSLGSLTSQDSNILQPSSRRLARTLSLRSTVDDRSKSSIPRNRDYHSRNSHLFNSSELGQEGKNSFDNFTASLHTQDYVPDTEESPINRTRGDYHPPTCRSLSLLDSKDRSFSTHRGSSASDFGDYTLRSKPLDMERVLPPLPYNAGSQGRRRESGRSSSYARQRSMDMAGSPYGNHLNGSGHRFQHSSIKEEVTQDRPHHSSSLPSMVKTKENKSSYTSKSPERVNRESKVSSNYEVDRHVPKIISSNSSISSHLNNPKFQSADNSNLVVKDGTAGFRSKHQDTSLNKNGTTRSSSEYKGRSQIPSLLRFRSSSVSRDVEKQKKKDLNKNEEVSSSVRKPRLSSSSRSTPDRSILSKFFRPGSEEKEVIREVDSAGEDKDAAKKKRRISRFLRPDFFDTPREESVYAKEKDAKKAAEAESKLKLRKSLRKPVGSYSQDTTDKNVEKNSVSVSSDNINTNKDGTDLKNSSKREVAETGEEKETGEQIQLTNEVKEKSNAVNCGKKLEKGTPAFEKQSNNSNNKSRFLHSLEKKLEKFRSSGDDIPSASSSSGKSRVDKAIRSLREQSLTPRGVDIITSESHLLKRAVSVSDCCTVESISKNQMPLSKDNAGSKLGNKVTSVLGLFRKLEDTPVKTHQSSPPQPSVLSRLRRTQSVYAGSQSDSVLLNTGADASGSSEFRPVPPLRLKKTNSNSSVKKPIEGAKTIQKESLEAGKKTETYSQNPELKMLENKTIKHTTENILGSEIALDTSNTAQENGNLARKQQESSVPKLVKRGCIKSKTKNTTEAGNKIQPKNATSTGSGAKSASVLVQGKCSENYTNVKSPAQNNTMSVRPHSLNGLKGVIPDNVIKTPEASDMPAVKKLDKATSINENVSLTTDVKALCPPCENKNKDNLSKNKHDSEKRETVGQDSTNHSAVAGKADELESCVSSEISPSTDNAFDNSPVDDFSLNDDEIRFANVKRLDSYPYPADDCSVLSPADESESFDSWSVCSDFESREFPTSPIPPPGDDVEESVGDRIRRKSFYSRFNDIKKKHRKSSLSSIGSLSSSYRDSNSVSFLHHPRNFSRKKDHPLDYVSNSSHSAYHPLQPHRNQSLYAQNDYDDRLVPYSRRSPIPPKSEGTEHMARGMNGYVDEFSSTDSHQRTSLSVDEDIQQAASTVGESVHFRGGSMEILRLPRNFNHNTNLDTVPNQHIPLYSDSIRRGSDSRLSRSTESNIGATIPKSRLPATWDRHLTLTPRFSSNNIGVAVTSHPDSAVTLGSVAGETLPLHGKYNRYNSNSPLDAPSSIYIGSPTPAGENIWMDSERPVTPH